MELDISKFFFNCEEPEQYSASVMEMGDCAGRMTWENACREARVAPILHTEEEYDAVRRYIKAFGAWSETEIANWSPEELNALVIQFIAGNMRETGLGPDSTDDDWAEYEAGASKGRFASNIFRGDDGQVYFDLE